MSNINIKKPVIRDLKTSYGEKFTEINEKLLTELRKPNSSGITFLHGEPVRHLIYSFSSKAFLERLFSILVSRAQAKLIISDI